MTSSYNNTNYLSTEADLSAVVNKQIDADIKDTERFYQQMMELEKARYDQQFENLSALASFAKSISPIIQKIKQANADREETKDTVGIAKEELEDANSKDTTEEDINEHKKTQAQLQGTIEDDIDNAKTAEEKYRATDIHAYAGLNPISFENELNAKVNLTRQATNVESVIKGLSEDNSIDALGNKLLREAIDVDEFDFMYDQYEYMIYQALRSEARAQGGDYTIRQIRRYFAPTMVKVRQSVKAKWNDQRIEDIKKRTQVREFEEIKSLFSTDSTSEDILGKNGWITTKKAEYEARGLSTKDASLQAAIDFGEYVIPALSDPSSGIDAAKVRAFLNDTFTFLGSDKEITMNDPRAPIGIQRLHRDLSGALDKYQRDADEQETINENLKIQAWGDVEHVEFVKSLTDIQDPKDRFVAVQDYVLRVRKEFNIGADEALPDFVKDFMAGFELTDQAIVTEITARRVKNLPVTQTMIDKIADPDIRAAQSQYVNTPELGAFTEEEAESMDERVVAIVKEAKGLKDLDQAKTDQYLVTRDNTKEYVTARFKELVVGGQSRKTAMYNAISEAKGFVSKGDFDTETALPINTQATLDLQSTLNAIGKDPSLIYSTEEWAGEAPHLALAREYLRTKGQSAYPSYYLRFNFIKNADGAYLTPEEIFKARVAKVDKKEEDKTELPERTELDNVEDQNKLLNKNNATKTLDVATKKDNIEWMIKTMPSVSGLNAERFIRQLEINIQNQQFIGGVSIPHKQKTTLSKEDNDKLLEAVPELKEAPFLNPNTLSTAAINEMLKLNI
tara:strand:- start:6701 stop:9079 length:2379 start_codon:yes stop_codon:yes gene_type:complete